MELSCSSDYLADAKVIKFLFLIKMKGADQLLEVARKLKQLKVKFEMFISGAGELEEMMHQQIVVNQFNDCVKMLGVPDFKTNFIPFVKQNIDLFVSCHPQGDHSCTYIETISAGVPIVGYANEAFLGNCRNVGDRMGCANESA